jgi:hypothetical protein
MKKHQLIISEPWDYKNQKGNNFHSGKLINKLDGNTAIFESDNDIISEGFTGRLFLLFSRYEKVKIDECNNKNGVSVGISFLKTKHYDNLTVEEIQSDVHSKYLFIGGLYPDKTWS